MTEKTPKIVREIRSALRETQAQFALRLRTTQAMVARWETAQKPTPEWLERLREVAARLGLDDHAAELSGMVERLRIKPTIEMRTEEETEYVTATLRILRRRGEYAEEFEALEKVTDRARKANARIMTHIQAKQDARQAVIRLRDRGHSPVDIAEILGLDENEVNIVLAFHDLRESSAKEQK